MADRILRVLSTAGALDVIVPMVAPDGIAFDPVLVDDRDDLLWRGERRAIEEARPEIGWFSPELFQRGLTERFLELAARAPSLGWMQSARAGFNDPGLAAVVANGARLTTSDGPAVAIAEYVLGQVLDHFQLGPERRAAQASRRWQPLAFREIGRTRWLILGFGAIGRAIAKRARAFGAHVTGVRRSGGADDCADAITTPDAMGAALGEADVIVICLPLSAQTENVIDARFLSGTKSGALLLNVGRGGLLDEDAFRAALDAGRPGHAVLDVARIEPLPVESWIWDHPQITLTAHTSGWGDGTTPRTHEVFAENLRRFVNGRALLNEVSAADVRASAGF